MDHIEELCSVMLGRQQDSIIQFVPKPPAKRVERVNIDGKDIALSFEPETWTAIEEIMHREQCCLQSLCEAINAMKRQHLKFLEAIGIFIIDYFFEASCNEGHRRVGHGLLAAND